LSSLADANVLPSGLTLQRSEAFKLSGSLLTRLSGDRVALLVVSE
jgi:hypothetical protein